MPVYRYKRTGLAIKDIKAQVPPADAASVSAGSIGPTQVWDITAPTTSLDDINDFMASRGWTYDSTDPAETPAEQSAGDQDHGDLTGLGDDDHSIYHNDTRGDARYYQKTEWTNKAQLDLVTDGDHDVRTDNPHSVTAVQAGAAASTHASQHQHSGSDEVATATPAANAIPKADGSGKLDSWVTGGGSDAEDLIVTCLKGSVGTINPGQAVRVTGYNIGQDVPEVELADSSAAATMPAFGIARTTVTNAATGTIVVSGRLTGQDTSSWSVGDELYVSETAGALTATKPTGTALVQKIAQVTRSNPSVGVLQIFGAGRSNDLPNIAQNNLWMGDGSGVPTATSRSGIDDTAIHDSVAAEISGITAKATPTTSDYLLIEDAADTDTKKSITIGDLPAAAPASHASSHEPGGGDAMTVDAAAATGSLRTLGTGAAQACAGNDSRLSDARTPTSHASSHQHGGSDEVATATPAANAIPKADGSGSLDAWVTGGSGDVVGPASATDNALARFDTTTGKLLQNSPVIVSDAGAMTGVTTYNGVTVTDHNARHESGGADSIKLDDLAAPDDNTDLDASTSKHGLLKKLGGGTTNFLRADGAWAAPPGSTHIFSHKMFQADQMESPVSSNWAVNALAPLIPDASNTALSVRAFDDTTVEGIGFTMRVPTGATNIILGFLSRAASTPGGSVNVGLNLYKRAVPDNAVIPAWGSATALTNLAFTTNAYYQKDSQTIAISTLGLTVGVTYLFELCRNVPTDTLSGDWLLHSLTVGWS